MLVRVTHRFVRHIGPRGTTKEISDDKWVKTLLNLKMVELIAAPPTAAELSDSGAPPTIGNNPLAESAEEPPPWDETPHVYLRRDMQAEDLEKPKRRGRPRKIKTEE